VEVRLGCEVKTVALAEEEGVRVTTLQGEAFQG
jgi:hypothetical protein